MNKSTCHRLEALVGEGPVIGSSRDESPGTSSRRRDTLDRSRSPRRLVQKQQATTHPLEPVTQLSLVADGMQSPTGGKAQQSLESQREKTRENLATISREPLKVVFSWNQPSMMTVNGEGKQKGQMPYGIYALVALELVRHLHKDDPDFNISRDVQMVKVSGSPSELVTEDVQASECPKVVITLSNKKPADILNDHGNYDIFFFGDEHQTSPQGAFFSWTSYYAQLGIDAVIPMRFALQLQEQEAVKDAMSGGKELSEAISLDLLVRMAAAIGTKLHVVSTPKASFTKVVEAYFARSEAIDLIGRTDVKQLTFKEDQLKEKVVAYNSSDGQAPEPIMRWYLGKADNFQQMETGCGKGQAVLLQGENRGGLLQTFQSLAVSNRGGKHPKSDIKKVQEFVDMLTSDRGNLLMNEIIVRSSRKGVVFPIRK